MTSIQKIAITIAAGLVLALSANAQQDIITTVIGGGPNAMPAVDANVYYAYEVATDSAGNFYYTAAYEGRVFKATPGGNVTLIAGIGGQNAEGYNGDGIQATSAYLNFPQAVAVDSASPPNVYIADTNNCVIRKVNGSTGIITTVAGYAYTDSAGNPHTSCGWGSYTDNHANGFSSNGDGGKATLADLYSPLGIGLDGSGNLYIADQNNGRVREVNASTGNISTVAGGGGSTTAGNNCGGSSPWGDGAAATSAFLCSPQGVAVDASVTPPNVFVTNADACSVREIVGGTGGTKGNIYRVAGSYTLGCGFSGDGSSATSAQLSTGWQVWAQASAGTTTVTVADYGNSRIRQFTVNSSGTPTSGNISTIAGGGSTNCLNENIPAIESCLQPIGVAFDTSGNYFIGDYGYERVREVSKSTGNINTVAGWGYPYYPYPVGNNVPLGTDYQLYYPWHVHGDSSGNIYVAGYQDESVFAYNSSTGALSQVTGNGTAGYLGDTVIATNGTIELNGPTDVVKDSNGNIFISDYNNCVIREIAASTGDIHTVVGGTDNSRFGCGFKDGALSAGQINGVWALAIDSNNNLYLADSGNERVREVNLGASTITTIAGNGTYGFTGDGGAATSAELTNALYGLSVDSAGNVYISDSSNYRVRKVTAATGIINTIAGNGAGGFEGDGVPATETSVYAPYGLALDAAGDLFLADYNNQRVRMVDTAGIIHTIAGNGTAGYVGQGVLATSAELYYPTGVTTDSSGNIYLADYYNWVIRKVSALNVVGSSPPSASFEPQPVHTTSASVEFTLTAAGTANITSITSSAGFTELDNCPITLTNGASCTVDVAFAPSTPGVINGTLTVSYNGFFGPSTVVKLQGTATGLTISPSPLAFGAQLINTIVTKSITVKGSTTYKSPSATLSGDTTDFTIASNTCTATVTISCVIGISFDPLSLNGKKATLSIHDSDPTNPQLVGITGTGTEVTISPTALAFGTVTTGSSTKSVTVTNKGTTTLTFSGTPTITGTGSVQFSVITGSSTCLNGTVTMTQNVSCTINVQFTSTSKGVVYSETMSISDNGGGSPQLVKITGTD